MYPKERNATYLQQLRNHVDESTPKVERKKTDWTLIVAYVAGAIAAGGLIHQLWERL